MIKLTLSRGGQVAVNPLAISDVIDAAVSSKWHGINCYVRTHDGRSFEVLETFERVTTMLDDEYEKSHGLAADRDGMTEHRQSAHE